MSEVADREHVRAAGHVRRLLSRWRDVETLVRIGEYKAGSDPEADEAIAKHAQVQAFLAQPVDEVVDFYDSMDQLGMLS